ncbi:MAG: lysophospholipase [Candidatus Obscuribacterales bacterium]|nr:lysophospholipase [Candidatus Obscuribacterales bacterium]
MTRKARADTKSRPRVPPSKLVITTGVQLAVWFGGAYAFLYLDSLMSISPAINVLYALVLLMVLAFIPSLCAGPTRLDPAQYPNRFTRLCKERLRDLTHGCYSPCIILIELLALTGNFSTWAMFEPVMFAGIAPPSYYRDADPLPDNSLEPQTSSVRVRQGTEERIIDLATPEGVIAVKTNKVSSAPTAVLAVGGVGGGFDSPANELYERLSEKLQERDIRFIDVSFTKPGDFSQSVYELRAAIRYARSQGARRFILIGHSFGGGVVISAALREPGVVSVFALSSQTYGGGQVAELAPRRLHLIHGFFDFVVPRCAAERLYRAASPPKDLHLVPATHLLNESADQVFNLVLDGIAADNN